MSAQEHLNADKVPLRAHGERDETGWLIEENATGVIHWIALAVDAWPWTKLFADMAANKDNPQVARAIEVGRPIIEAITSSFASADTRPEGGDSTKIEAPFTSGAGPKE